MAHLVLKWSAWFVCITEAAHVTARRLDSGPNRFGAQKAMSHTHKDSTNYASWNLPCVGL